LAAIWEYRYSMIRVTVSLTLFILASTFNTVAVVLNFFCYIIKQHSAWMKLALIGIITEIANQLLPDAAALSIPGGLATAQDTVSKECIALLFRAKRENNRLKAD
jgi:hypothetical protein